jgi:hypothetical protein
MGQLLLLYRLSYHLELRKLLQTHSAHEKSSFFSAVSTEGCCHGGCCTGPPMALVTILSFLPQGPLTVWRVTTQDQQNSQGPSLDIAEMYHTSSPLNFPYFLPQTLYPYFKTIFINYYELLQQHFTLKSQATCANIIYEFTEKINIYWAPARFWAFWPHSLEFWIHFYTLNISVSSKINVLRSWLPRDPGRLIPWPF